MKKILFSLLTSVFSLALVMSAAPAFAETVSVNFENPAYTLGVINGQQGWSSLGAASLGCAVYDQAVNSSLGVSGFGSQSFRVSDAVTSGCFGDQAFSKPLTNSVGETAATDGGGVYSVGTKQRHFEMQFDIASTVPGAQQPDLHVSVSPDRGDGSRMSYLRFEDGVSGINVFFDDVSGTGPISFDEVQVGTNLSRTVPHTVKLTMDVVDGASNDIVKVYIDGVLVKTGTSWENYYRFDPEASAEQSPRIIKNVLFRSGGTAVPADAGKGFLFDNLRIMSGPILVGPPTNINQCKNNGWKTFNNPVFRSQIECTIYTEIHKIQQIIRRIIRRHVRDL